MHELRINRKNCSFVNRALKNKKISRRIQPFNVLVKHVTQPQNDGAKRVSLVKVSMIEKLFHEKDELSHSCRELSEALTSVRTQHDASI